MKRTLWLANIQYVKSYPMKSSTIRFLELKKGNKKDLISIGQREIAKINQVFMTLNIDLDLIKILMKLKQFLINIKCKMNQC